MVFHRGPLVLLILGLVGLILFVLGFSMPDWVAGDRASGVGVSHGVWRVQTCAPPDSCTQKAIEFGVSGVFEAGRVFLCATIGAAVIAFFFNVRLIRKTNRAWSVRTCILWILAGVFGVVGLSLFAVGEPETAEALALGLGIADGSVVSFLDWAFWVAVAGVALFWLLGLAAAVCSCGDFDEGGSERRLLTHSIGSNGKDGNGMMFPASDGSHLAVAKQQQQQQQQQMVATPRPQVAEILHNQAVKPVRNDNPFVHSNPPVMYGERVNPVETAYVLNTNGPTSAPAAAAQREVLNSPTGAGPIFKEQANVYRPDPVTLSLPRPSSPLGGADNYSHYSVNVRASGVSMPRSQLSTASTLSVAGYGYPNGGVPGGLNNSSGQFTSIYPSLVREQNPQAGLPTVSFHVAQ